MDDKFKSRVLNVKIWAVAILLLIIVWNWIGTLGRTFSLWDWILPGTKLDDLNSAIDFFAFVWFSIKLLWWGVKWYLAFSLVIFVILSWHYSVVRGLLFSIAIA